MRNSIMRALVVVAVLCSMVVLSLPSAEARNPNLQPRRERDERHPKLRQAINALERAKDDLQDAARDFCGHREDALESLNNAISQLRQALGSDRTALEPMPGGLDTATFEKASWQPRRERRERHPKIEAAIRALRSAKDYLEDASHDFHGHRVEALEATNRALERLQAALQCDRT
jgi:chromosome segregation ATPase